MEGAAERLQEKAASRSLCPITAKEFVSRFKGTLERHEGRFAFFLGAGCSISSGIPGAAELTREWVHQLHSWRNRDAEDYHSWVSREFPGYTDNEAARFYSIVMDTMFPRSAQRQMEIERMIEGNDPGFGYAVLARMMTDGKLHGRCNFAFTTNFDDLIADAVYLYTRRKPLVIGHHSLCSFVEISRTRPLVLKLHGDAWIEPLSTVEEIANINDSFKACVGKLAQEMGLVFIGYGGNDRGISETLFSLGRDMLKWGIYWINDTIPETNFGEWLLDRKAVWVKHLDFDQLMALLQTEFQLSHPDYDRFRTLHDNYMKTFERLVESVERQPNSKEKENLSAALISATEMSDDWRVWSSYARKQKDVMQGRKVFEDAIGRFPGCAPLLGSYANFLADQAHDPRAADEYYNLALAADGDCIDALTDYAVFLEDTWKESKASLL